NRDFRLKPDSPALKLGFEPIDTSKVGLYGDSDWVALPKTIKHKPFTFPGPSEPEPMSDGYEGKPVGDAANGMVAQEKEGATIRVSDEQAAAGKQSLKFIDRHGLDPAFYPFGYYQPNYRKGMLVGRFALYRVTDAALYHEWR